MKNWFLVAKDKMYYIHDFFAILFVDLVSDKILQIPPGSEWGKV